MNIADTVNDAVREDDDVDMMDAAARKTNDAVPTSHLTKYHDDVSLATLNDEAASVVNDEPDTPTMNDAVARGTNESPAATDAPATSGGSAVAVTMLPEATVTTATSSRRRTRKTNAPATRRSARIREQAQRHVHWATTVPSTDDVNDTNDVNEANDVNDTAPIADPPTATTTTTRTVSTDALEGVREAITTVDPRTMITTMVGTETRTTLGTVPLMRAPTPCDDGAPAKRADVARDDERRAVTTSARRSDAVRGGRRRAPATQTHVKMTTPAPRRGKVSARPVEEAQADEQRAPKTTARAKSGARAPATATTLVESTTTPATKAKPTTKATAKKSTTNVTTVKTKKVPTTASVVNDAVAVTNDVDGMDGNDDTAPVDDYTLQLSDDEIVTAQQRSKFVKRLLAAGKYGSMKAESKYGLVTIETTNGWRVVLPPTLWSTVFKEMHGSRKWRSASTTSLNMKINSQHGMYRRQQRLFWQRRRLLSEQRVLEERSDRERQWTTLLNTTSRVDSWWNDEDGEGATEQGRRARTRWTSVAEYEQLYRDDRVVEDPGDEEVV
ncbi:Gag-pol fusion protein [Phytophthora cinnamomi]|uniref:Gag-pol fusion protein n=1 Tax=Phytophthora cinnamomi TaxID=4785 RepID=UPI0035595D62|nr:Gag-pol fusion protein [Phytophthora cinnamomi]